jgi:hypothetical protein
MPMVVVFSAPDRESVMQHESQFHRRRSEQHEGRFSRRRRASRARGSLLSRLGISFGLVEILLVAGMVLFLLFLVVWLPFALAG